MGILTSTMHTLNISLVSANQSKNFISFSKEYVFIFLKENQSREELVRVKSSMKVLVPKVALNCERES
jgi:hypothetical protein